MICRSCFPAGRGSTICYCKKITFYVEYLNGNFSIVVISIIIKVKTKFSGCYFTPHTTSSKSVFNRQSPENRILESETMHIVKSLSN